MNKFKTVDDVIACVPTFGGTIVTCPRKYQVDVSFGSFHTAFPDKYPTEAAMMTAMQNSLCAALHEDCDYMTTHWSAVTPDMPVAFNYFFADFFVTVWLLFDKNGNTIPPQVTSNGKAI